MVGIRRFGCSIAAVTLVSAGMAVIAPLPAAAASSTASCFPLLERMLTQPGNFQATTAGSGAGDVTIESGVGPAAQGTGRIAWSVRQEVTGNTAGPGGSMSGSLALAVTLGGSSIAFTSSCILESGVFAGEIESDPFAPEADNTVLRGVEGEWIGTAYNFPVPGQSSQVVASLAVWTTIAGPRFHLDMTTAVFTPGQCPDESGVVASVSVGGPTRANSAVMLSAPDQQAGRGECAGQQQQQQED